MDRKDADERRVVIILTMIASLFNVAEDGSGS